MTTASFAQNALETIVLHIPIVFVEMPLSEDIQERRKLLNDCHEKIVLLADMHRNERALYLGRVCVDPHDIECYNVEKSRKTASFRMR